jgi:hypothetical protein
VLGCTNKSSGQDSPGSSYLLHLAATTRSRRPDYQSFSDDFMPHFTCWIIDGTAVAEIAKTAFTPACEMLLSLRTSLQRGKPWPGAEHVRPDGLVFN